VTDKSVDAKSVRRAILDELRVHVRLQDQGHGFEGDLRQRLADAIPDLMAFADNNFRGVRAVLDWDHQIPSQYALLRILACYDDDCLERVDAVLADRDEDIAEGNLYPEFDVPDYGEIDASESYVALLRPGEPKVEDFRFLSPWRKQVGIAAADAAVAAVKDSASYKGVVKNRVSEGLGGPVVIGWAPPCLAATPDWGVEVWVLTEFDGHQGKARVFMVDPDRRKVTREFETDVQLA
jgi:hypothetical protein